MSGATSGKAVRCVRLSKDARVATGKTVWGFDAGENELRV